MIINKIKSILRKIVPFRIISKADRELLEVSKRSKNIDNTQYIIDMYTNAVIKFATDPFPNHQINDSTILIVEPNPYHYETLPSYVNYFQRLGYDVELIAPKGSQEAFCRVPKEQHPTFHFCDSPSLLQLYLTHIKNYKFVLFSSQMYKDWQRGISVRFDGVEKFSTVPYYYIAHDIRDTLKEEYFQNKHKHQQLISLSGFQDTPQVNPCYFGNVTITPKNKITKIAIVGVRQDTHYLLQALRQLDQPCEIYNIGVHNIQGIDIPHITIKNLGRLDFEEMYTYIEECDFILSQLHMGNGYFERFTTDMITGSNQLVLAFQKPWIIGEPFATAYRWTRDSAIIHQEGQLDQGIKSAIAMSQDEYANMQREISKVSQELQEIALLNLEKILKTH